MFSSKIIWTNCSFYFFRCQQRKGKWMNCILFLKQWTAKRKKFVCYLYSIEKKLTKHKSDSKKPKLFIRTFLSCQSSLLLSFKLFFIDVLSISIKDVSRCSNSLSSWIELHSEFQYRQIWTHILYRLYALVIDSVYQK